MAYAKIRPRRGTAYMFAIEDPIPVEGELVIEYPDSGVGTGLCKFKIGDGTRHWSELPYAFDGNAAYSIEGGSVTAYHFIGLRRGTSAEWSLIDPILEEGEISYDTTNNSIKVGDGLHTWTELKYISSGNDIDNVIDCGNEDEEG